MLKSLELFGFKSFADRTRFDFSPGITGVVGPNGSGKSNVVDAIKWILGDQSPKSLRGKEMTDVIFNGSSDRKPSAFAEATLTFDNGSGFLPTDSQEVLVGRRLWRNGDSEYLINRAAVRLKDVRELFMGTGAATSAYSIIEQGRVDQILQSNPIARRAVFEEAAGISRFKARKTEALRKLERVDQNLLRLTDIVDEVESQLNSTRSQASKAAKFREVADELRELWQGLAADDYRHLSSRLEVCEAACADFQHEIDALNGRQQELENRLAAVDVEISEVDDNLRQVERRAASNRETVASHVSTIGHQNARLNELEAELLRLQTQRLLMLRRTREAVLELERMRLEVTAAEQEFLRNKTGVDARAAQIERQSAGNAEARLQIDEQRRRSADLAQRSAATVSRIHALESQLQAVTAAGQKSAQRGDELDRELETCRGECDRRRAAADDVDEQVAACGQTIAHIEGKQSALHAELRKFEKSLAEQREQRSAWQARRSILEDLERRQEGFGIGVKEILNRARSSQYPPWNQILGSVADLFEADLQDAALLEVALGSRAQLIVVRDDKPLIDYLNAGGYSITGRVGFIAIAGRRGPTPADRASGPDLSGRPGVIKRADRLVAGSADIGPLAEALLADTWIVAALDVALRLAEGPGRGCRFLSLQGELLEADGTLYVGTVGGETAVVSRKSELRRLKNDLLLLERNIAAEQGKLSNLGRSLTDIDEELDAARSERQRLISLLADKKADALARQQELHRLERERQSVDEESARAAAHAAQLHRELETARSDVAQIAEDQQLVERAIDDAQNQASRAEQLLRLLEQKQNEDLLVLAKHEERLQSLQTSHLRLQDEARQRREQSDEANRRFDAAAAKQRQTTLQVLNSRAVLAELFLNDEALAREIAEQLSEKQSFRQQRSALAQEESRIRQRRREVKELEHSEEIAARDIRHQITTLEARIEEEYQLSLTDLVASGLSAFETYCRAPRTEGQGPTAGGEEQKGEGEDHDADVRDLALGPQPSALGPFEQVRDEIEAQVNRLRKKLKLMGNVNTDSLHDLDELEKRYRHLKDQLQDLVEARTTLEEIVRKINAESKRLFIESFDAIRGHFEELFRKLFGGGEGNIILEDPEDVLDCGIDIVARPPGKELRSISLLSGGEKTMTAVAMLLAIFRSRPSPFCILDEVDAALDEANVDRYTGVVKMFQETTQFIMITHHKRTMMIADLLYGVTMEQAGVSKRMSVRFEDVSDNGEIRARSADAA